MALTATDFEHIETIVTRTVNKVVNNLEGRLDQRFDAIERRFQGIDVQFKTIDTRFEQFNVRFEQINVRFEQIESGLQDLATKKDLDRMESRLVAAMSLLERDTTERLDQHEVRIAKLESRASAT